MEPSVARLQLRHWALLGVLAGLASVWGRQHLWGLVVGGGAIGLSLFLYATGFTVVLRRQSRRLAIAILFVKLAAFLGLGWLVFSASEELRPDPLGFAVGVSCMPVAAVWEAIRARKG
jgi:hypothetical protein